jgi:hypothetical protein
MPAGRGDPLGRGVNNFKQPGKSLRRDQFGPDPLAGQSVRHCDQSFVMARQASAIAAETIDRQLDGSGCG